MSEEKKTNGHPTRWKKGDPSPNPNGRPKSVLSKEAITKIAIQFASEPDPFDPQGRMRITRLFEKVYEAAIGKKTGQPSIRAAGELLDRILGKPPQSVSVEGNLNVTREERLASIEELFRKVADVEHDPERVH